MSAQNLCFLVAIPLTLTGVWMRWRIHDYRMAAEDAMKARRLSAEQVGRRMAMIRTVANTLTITGSVLLVATITVMAE